MAHHLARPLLPIHFCGRTPTVANWTPTGQLKLLSLQRHAWVHCHVLTQTGIELATGYSGPGGSAQLQLLKPFPHLSVASSGLSCSAQELSLQPAGSAAPWQARSQCCDRGSNPRPLHQKADFQPLDHQGSPSRLLALRWSPAQQRPGHPSEGSPRQAAACRSSWNKVTGDQV